MSPRAVSTESYHARYAIDAPCCPLKRRADRDTRHRINADPGRAERYCDDKAVLCLACEVA